MSKTRSHSIDMLTIELAKVAFDNICFADNLEIDKSRLMAIELIREIVAINDVANNLAKLKTIDNYTLGHSISVCILSIVTGLSLNLDNDNLMDLALGALLHDIGKIHIKNSILNKPQILNGNEYKQIKRHSILGYEAIKNIEGFKQEIGWIIRDHHERYDGRGYPRGLSAKEIHIYPRIVSICDTYDALTTKRVYRCGIPVYQAVEYLLSMRKRQFDPELVERFVGNLSIYPIGTIVKLQSGHEGIVVESRRNNPTRPTVELVRDLDGRFLNFRRQVDLSKTLNNGILSVIKAV